jgi:hypothetical protein
MTDTGIDSSTDSNALVGLLAEHDIRRVLLTYARGIDRRDRDLVESCYWPDAQDWHGTFRGTRDEFLDWVMPLLARQTMTMHNLANIMIDLETPDTAGVETYGVAYHSGGKPGDIRWNYAAGFRYVDRFAKRDGQWRIADRITVIEWVAPWDADAERHEIFGRLGSLDRQDPVYDFGDALREQAAAGQA